MALKGHNDALTLTTQILKALNSNQLNEHLNLTLTLTNQIEGTQLTP